MDPLAAFTEHGGRVAMARARFGGEDWIDLSTGIAPWAYPIEGMPLDLDRLPEPQAIAALEAAAAAAFGIDDPAGVVAVPGTDLAMRLLAGLIGAERPAVVEPGYAGHRAAWPRALGVTEALGSRRSTGTGRTDERATIDPDPNPDPHAVHAPASPSTSPLSVRAEPVEAQATRTPADTGRMAEATADPVTAPAFAATSPSPVRAEPVEAQAAHPLADRDLLVLASPANPTGRVTDPARLSRLTQGMTVVLDQAYADPDPCPPPNDRLIVLRSFGKFYGLPGLRLGFVAAGPTIAMRLRALLGDWPVSSAAVAIGTAAFRDIGWRDAQAARIELTARRLDTVLQRAGLSIRGRAPLFRLIETDDAARLFARLARRAILTRPFVDAPRWLRIGLPCDEVALDRLASALEDAHD